MLAGRTRMKSDSPPIFSSKYPLERLARSGIRAGRAENGALLVSSRPSWATIGVRPVSVAARRHMKMPSALVRSVKMG
jgi:hypothetical protein